MDGRESGVERFQDRIDRSGPIAGQAIVAPGHPRITGRMRQPGNPEMVSSMLTGAKVSANSTESLIRRGQTHWWL
jgi:hypothetical protein